MDENQEEPVQPAPRFAVQIPNEPENPNAVFRSGPIPWVFFPALVCAIYLQLLGLYSAMNSDYSTYFWTRVEARVARVSADTHYSRRGSHSSLDLVYRYRYKGRLYDGTNYGVGPTYEFMGEPGFDPDDWSRAHTEGSRITAYVDPRDPRFSAVDPRPTFVSLVEMLITVPFSVLGLTALLTEAGQSRIDFEKLAWTWGGIVLALYLIGNAITPANAFGFVVYFGVLIMIYLNSRRPEPEPEPFDGVVRESDFES